MFPAFEELSAMFQGSAKEYWLPTPFASSPFTSPTPASTCAITFQLQYNIRERKQTPGLQGKQKKPPALQRAGFVGHNARAKLN